MNTKRILRCVLSSLSVLLLLSTPASAQKIEKENAQKEVERKQELKRKSLVLIDEIAAGALSLKLPENRSYVLAAAADLLWEHDEKRARTLFWDALGGLNLILVRNESSAKAPGKEKAQSENSYFAIFAMRQEILRRAARHDPQFALDILRATRQPPPERVNTGFRFPDNSELEQQIVAEAAARDPKAALRLARESLAKGFTFELFNLLYQLNQKDTALGSKFAGDIIEKLRSSALANDLYGSRIATSLLTFSRSPAKISSENLPASAIEKRLMLETEQRRELVEMITNAALEVSANAVLLFAIDEVMPEILELAPERVPMLERKLAVFNQTLNKDQKIAKEYNSLVQNGTPEEMLRLANRAGNDDRERIQRQAIVSAVMRGRADSLRDLINTEVEEDSRRESLIAALETEQINSAVQSGNIEELRKLLPQVRRQEERARAMAQIAIVLEKKGDHDEAVKLLAEAQPLIKSDLTSETHTNALLALVAAYALVEPAKAFSIVERIIDRANDEISKTLLLDRIVRSGVVKKGEIILQQSGMIPPDLSMFNYGEAMAALASADFDRTKAAADRLQRNELRIIARLLLAQALLQGNAQPETNEEQ